MFLRNILPGLIATYLAAAPCVVLNYGSSAQETGGVSVAQVHGHDTRDAHHSDSESSDDDGHCCEDLSGSIHAPLKEIPTSVAVVDVAPSFVLQVATLSTEHHVALSRDGPLYERASEFAKTIVIRS